MDLLHWFLDFLLHIDQHLAELLAQYGTAIILIVALIIFCETGLVVTPILPGDSMLFAFGALAAQATSGLSVHVSVATFIVAAFVGNQVNYSVGRYIGPKVYEKNYRFIKREYLDRTRRFFEKYGAITIVYTRFAPILRTFAPFVAGVGQMPLGRFTAYNLIGGIAWVTSFTYAGYFFGNIPFVKEHFKWIVLLIIIVSLLPAIYAFVKVRLARRSAPHT
ncbi:MAG: DedA family protein [Chitinophagales bacterium]|nr:DedA family protein [Chitinophagales bacterium]MDW8393120.1 DedA family protein [Chitinophagales bacterium]